MQCILGKGYILFKGLEVRDLHILEIALWLNVYVSLMVLQGKLKCMFFSSSSASLHRKCLVSQFFLQNLRAQKCVSLKKKKLHESILFKSIWNTFYILWISFPECSPFHDLFITIVFDGCDKYKIYTDKYFNFFSVTRRSRSDESHFNTNWVTESALALTLLMWPWWVMIPIEDFTDVILITLMTLLKVI